jgi:hypothetical protein
MVLHEYNYDPTTVWFADCILLKSGRYLFGTATTE